MRIVIVVTIFVMALVPLSVWLFLDGPNWYVLAAFCGFALSGIVAE